MQNPQTDQQIPFCTHRNVSVKEISFSGNIIFAFCNHKRYSQTLLIPIVETAFTSTLSLVETHFPLVHFPVCPCQAPATPVWTEKVPGSTKPVQLSGTRTWVFSFGSLWSAAQSVLREVHLVSTTQHHSQADEVECGDTHYLNLDPVLVQWFSCELPYFC